MTTSFGRQGKPEPISAGSGGTDLGDASLEEAWLRAQQRALLYLKSLHIHPRRSLELVLRALELAEKQGPSRSPVADTMRALRSVLEEEGISPADCEAWLFRNGKLAARGAQVTPPLNRGTMVPVELDRRPWLSYLRRLLGRGRSAGEKASESRESPARPPEADAGPRTEDKGQP